MSEPIKIRLVDKRPTPAEWNPGTCWYDGMTWMLIIPNGAIVWLLSLTKHKISGWPPNITVDPSILFHADPKYAEWHGWIKNGVITTV